MPGIDGLACLDAIKELDHPVAVVIVTLYDDRRYVLEAIRRGAAGYLLKDATTAEVLATIAARRGRPAGGRARAPARGAHRARPTSRRRRDAPGSAPRRFALTPRELDVLRLVAEGMTNKEIGGRLSIAEDTVKKHVQNIIWKLRAADRTQAAIIAYRIGLIEPDG